MNIIVMEFNILPTATHAFINRKKAKTKEQFKVTGKETVFITKYKKTKISAVQMCTNQARFTFYFTASCSAQCLLVH